MITSLKSIVSLNDTIREVRSTWKFHNLRLYNNIFIYVPFFFFLRSFSQKARKDEVKSQINIKTTKGHLKRRLIATDGEEDLARKYARMEL